MQPGERLDALVAEHIMGLKPGVDFGEWPEHKWKRHADGTIDVFAYEVGYHNGPACERCGYSYCEHCQDGPTQPCIVEPKPYSTSDAAALDIIAAMAKRGWDCATYYEGDLHRYTVYFFKHASPRAQSSSLAEAIAKAALLAVLEEVDAT